MDTIRARAQHNSNHARQRSNLLCWSSLVVLLAVLLAPVEATENRVVMSILTNDGFLLPAKVLAYRLKTLAMPVPYVLLVTENVSNSSIEELKSHNIEVRRTSLFTVPHAKKAAKYHYTKLRLWSLIEYDVVLYIDLDALPMRDLLPFFSCGSFCATFRHSDKFNAGMLVLKPNLTVYEDLISQAPLLPTYDGGDQGFLNSYFHELKFTPTFDHNRPDQQLYNSAQRRLSSEFNYDIGVYYLNGGRLLVEPAIIHYTMGPTKPWLWWTYPLFDLNEHWSKTRAEMEQLYPEPNPDYKLIAFTVLVAAIALIFRQIIFLIIKDRFRTDALNTFEDHFVHYLISWISFCFTWHLTPTSAHPFASWLYFIVNMNIFIICLSDVFMRIRSLTPTFGTRALFAIVFIATSFYLIPLICKRILIGTDGSHSKYQLLPVRKEYCH
ncbi:hypothetical protein Q1695_000184 [Nippostrongylus brasiliensis]|nr:hypothetical protein Q1695_000184 [Nippostrongylus brasiliensis]